uniref:Uncharacterized protein LOC114335699 isoform X2 n=1 Tax=Diabrotica virgifera virgifera TaxID=50390 RepID=A0A6P7FZ28_DIAVI
MDRLEKNAKLRPTRSVSFTLPEDTFSGFKSTSFQQSGKQFGQQQSSITVSGNSGQKYQIYQKSQPLVWSVQSSGQEVNGQGSGFIQQSYPDGNVKFSSLKWNSQGVNPGEQKFTFSQKVSDKDGLLNDQEFGQFGKVFQELKSSSNAFNRFGTSQHGSSLDSFPTNLDFQSVNDDLFLNHRFNVGNSLRNKMKVFKQMSTIGQSGIASEENGKVNNILQSKDIDQRDFDLNSLLDLMKQPSDQQSGKVLQISQQRSVQSEQPFGLISKTTSTQFSQKPHYVNRSPVLDLLAQLADQNSRKILQTTQHRSFLTEQPSKLGIKASTNEFGQSKSQHQSFHVTDQLNNLNKLFIVNREEDKGIDLQKNRRIEDLLDILSKHSNQISNGRLQQTQHKSTLAEQPIQFMTVGTNHQAAQRIPSQEFTTTQLNSLNQPFRLHREETKEQGFHDQSNHKVSEFGDSLDFGAKQSNPPSSVVVQQDSGIRLNNLQIDQPYTLFKKATTDQSNQIIQQNGDQKHVKHLYGLNELFDKQPKMNKDLDLQEDLVSKHHQQISNDMLQQNSQVDASNLFKKTTTHESSQKMQSSEHKSRLITSGQLQYAEQPFSILHTHTEESNHHSEKSNNMEHESSHTSLQIGDVSRPYEVVRTQTNHKVTKVEQSSKSEKRSTRRVTVQGPTLQVVGG